MNGTARLRMGMVGGGRGAFIGAVHRMAAALDGGVGFVAGALSSTPEKALASGRELGLPEDRNYPSWEAMLDGELALPPDERIDFVSIVTPNHAHFGPARAFADAGVHVVCDKPMVHTSAQARELIDTAERTGVVFAVTYNYSGYPMVKQARHMAAAGELGEIRKVIVEYNQGWLADRLEEAACDGGGKQAAWRTDPARAGLGGALGDIGSHAEHLVSYVTGLETESICADLTAFVPGRRLDDDANLLLRFVGGARGVLVASQVCTGSENALTLRVWGTTGGLAWRQEEPNELRFTPGGGGGEPERVLRRGHPYLCEAARLAARLPAGHPEAFIEAFANIYRAACGAMRAGRTTAPGTPRPTFDFPTVHDGARGVHFIERAVASGRDERKWTDARP